MSENEKVYYLWCLGVSATEIKKRFHIGDQKFKKIIRGRERVQAELKDEYTITHCCDCAYASCNRLTGEWWCRRKDPVWLTEEKGFCHRGRAKDEY